MKQMEMQVRQSEYRWKSGSLNFNIPIRNILNIFQNSIPHLSLSLFNIQHKNIAGWIQGGLITRRDRTTNYSPLFVFHVHPSWITFVQLPNHVDSHQIQIKRINSTVYQPEEQCNGNGIQPWHQRGTLPFSDQSNNCRNYVSRVSSLGYILIAFLEQRNNNAAYITVRQSDLSP